MFGIGNQSSDNSDNTDNSNRSSLQQARNNRANNNKNKKTLKDHASDALIGINSFIANANRKQQKNNSAQTGSTTIAEKKRKEIEVETKKIETFAEHTFVTIGKVLLYSSFGVDFMMFSEYYNKNNVMQGIDPNKYPYVEENPDMPTKQSTSVDKGIFSNKKSRNTDAASGKMGWRHKTDRMLLGYKDSWQAPWKNKATMEYPNVANWGLGKWIMFFATKVCAAVVATSRALLFKTFQVSSRIWNPKNILMNFLYLLSGWFIYVIVFKLLLMKGVWAGILTLVFVIIKSSLITKNWNLFTPPEDPDEEPKFISFGKSAISGFVKFMILFGLYMVLSMFNTFYLSGAFAFMFMLTPFMGDFVRGGDKNSKYNFRARFVELMWKNKMLISLFCLIFITVDAYKYLGKDAGYVFTGATVGLFLAFFYKLIMG
jgi:hypothetical protein